MKIKKIKEAGMMLGFFLFLAGCGREIKQGEGVVVKGNVSVFLGSGEINLQPAEGGIVKLQGDYNGDGRISENEIVKTYIDRNGDFEVKTILKSSYKGQVIFIIEKEGYASFIRTLPPGGSFTINTILYPSEKAFCNKGKCSIPSKKMVVENLPSNVSDGEFAVFNPVKESRAFPGDFVDSEGKMLISTVFGEVKLYDSDGNKIEEGKGPFKVKMLIPPETYSTLDDLNPDTERVEVPMFYFDEVKGVWVESVEGWLEYEGGREVKKVELRDIKEGKYAGNVYTVFYAPHLSWWNLDWADIDTTCVMGRVFLDGNPLPSAPVEATEVVSGTLRISRNTTASDGWFYVQVRRSEENNEDANQNGIKGEIYTVKINLNYNGITWELGEFPVPTLRSPYYYFIRGERNTGWGGCSPPNCKCGNIGDIHISTPPSTPSPCELYGIVKYSGIENVSAGSGNPPPAGSPVAGVSVSIVDPAMSPERKAEICTKNGTDICTPQTSDSSGMIHIFYAVDSSASYIANLVLKTGYEEEGFRGSGSITGCPASSPENPYEIYVDYYYRGDERYPTSPNGVTASAECGELVTLSWIDRSDNEVGFKIERKKEGENYKLLADLPPDTIFHYDSTTKRNTTYCYKVIAYRYENGVEFSSASPELCFTTPSKFCPPPPPSPSNLSGTMGPSLVSLTWKEVSREKGYKITRRIITDGPCSEGGGELPIETVYTLGYIEIGIGGEDATSFTDYRVKPLTCYCYRVFAFNDAGNSGSSNPFCGVVPECNEGSQRVCYTGPAGTLGVGVCSAGIQTCSSGRWGICENEVTPSDEICGDELDNDCDGYTDETCDTIPPDTILTSYPPSLTTSTTAVFEFTCNEEPCTYECNLDGGGFNPCSSPVTYTDLVLGEHYFEVKATDSYGNPDTTPATHQWRIASVMVDLLWTTELPSTVESSPTIADVDSDGIPEIIITAKNPAKVYCLNGENGSILWTYEPAEVDLNFTSPSLGDIDGDGKLEIVFGSYYAKVYALNAEDGTPLWIHTIQGYPTFYSVTSTPALRDMDNDGLPDVIVPSYSGGIHVLKGTNGNQIVAYPLGGKVMNSSPAIGDIDGHGGLEIVVGGFDDNTNIYAMTATGAGSLLWTYTTGGGIQSSPSLLNIGSDYDLDVVVGSFDGKIYAINGEFGNELWEYQTGGQIFSSPAVGDIDHNDLLDVVVGSRDGKVYALTANGSLLWEFPTGGAVDSSPVIGDVDGDGIREVVVGSRDGHLYAINGEDGSLLWKYTLSGPIVSSPLLGDVNGDGTVEVMGINTSGKVYALTTPFSIFPPSLFPWPEFGNRSYLRTRNADPWEHNDTEVGAVKLPELVVYGAIPGYIWNGINEYDYYSIDISPPASKIEIFLTDIPSGRDYDICLYDQWMRYLACSENVGTSPEAITYPISISSTQTFYFEVWSSQGWSSASPYSLFVHVE